MFDSGGNCHAIASAMSASGISGELEPGVATAGGGKAVAEQAGDDFACSGSDAPGSASPRCIRRARPGRVRRHRSDAARWPRPLSVSAAWISEPDCQRLRGLLRPRRRNDPRAAARGLGAIAARSASLRASSARSHSLSVPIERLLRLAEPMRSSRSSMIITLECTMVCGDALAVAHLRDRRRRTRSATPASCRRAQEPDAAVAHGVALEPGVGRVRRDHQRLRARASPCSRFASALAIASQVRNWFSM